MCASDTPDDKLDRRQAMKSLVVAPAFAAIGSAAPPSERYRLGVMCSMCAALPLDQAISRIVKIGYQYVTPARAHAGELVFTTEMGKTTRRAMLRRIRDLGAQPFMSLAGSLETCKRKVACKSG